MICRFPPTHPKSFHYGVIAGVFPGCSQVVLCYCGSSLSSSFCSSCGAIMSYALTFAWVPRPTTALIEDHPTVSTLAEPGVARFASLALRVRLYRLSDRKVDSDSASHYLPSPITCDGMVCKWYPSAVTQARFLDLVGFSRCLFTPEKKAADYRRLVFSGVSPGQNPRRLTTPGSRLSYLGSCDNLN